MNTRLPFARSPLPPSLLVAASLLVSAGAIAPARGEPLPPLPTTARLNGPIVEAESHAAVVRDLVDSGTWRAVNDGLYSLRSRRDEIDRRLADLGSLATRHTGEVSTATRLKFEWENAQREFDLFAQGHDRRGTSLTTEILEANRKADAHNARENDPMTDEQRRSYTAAAEAGNLEIAALKRRQADWLGEIDRRNQLRTIASNKERDYRLAEAAAARTEADYRARASQIEAEINAATAASEAQVAELSGARRAAESAAAAMQSPAPLRTYETYAPEARAEAPTASSAWQTQVPAALRREILVTPVAAATDLAGRMRMGQVAKKLADFREVEQPAPAPPPAPPPPDSTRLAWSRLPAVQAADGAAPADAVRIGADDLASGFVRSDWVTPAQRRAARDERDRLLDLEEKLAGRLRQLEDQRADLAGYEQELVDVRRELLLGGIRDLLDVFSHKLLVEDVYKQRLAGRFTAEQSAAIDLAVKEAKWLLSFDRVIHAEKDADRVAAAIGSATKGAAIVRDVALGLPKEHPLRPYGDLLFQTIELSAQVYKWQDERRRNPDAPWGKQISESLVTITRAAPSVVESLAKIGGKEALAKSASRAGFAAAAFKAAEAGAYLTYAIPFRMNPALDSLREAQSNTFDARRHLEQKLEHTRTFRRELERLAEAPSAPNSLTP